MMVQHFLSCQISHFSALFGVGDPYYRYLGAKREEDAHGEERCFSLCSKLYSVKGNAA